MYHAITSPAATENFVSRTNKNVFHLFYEWTVKQEEKRIMWLAFSFLIQIGLALPVTLLSVVALGGNNFNLWVAVCIVNVPSLVVNLAAQPTKVTIPILFAVWLVDAGIILYCAISYFAHIAV